MAVCDFFFAWFVFAVFGVWFVLAVCWNWVVAQRQEAAARRLYRHGPVDEGIRHCSGCLKRKVECSCDKAPYR
jgi:hypothetical protein